MTTESFQSPSSGSQKELSAPAAVDALGNVRKELMPALPHDDATELELETRAPLVAAADHSRPLFSHALDSVMDELLAMDPKRLVPVNVDVTSATTLVIGTTRELRRLEPEMVEWFGEEMASAVDRLELLSRAVSQAHARHRMEGAGPDLEPLSTAVAETRAALLAELASLHARKVVDSSSLGPLRRRGMANLGFDVLQLVSLFRSQWDTIQNATGYAREELDRAEGLASQLLTSVGVRQQAPRSPSADVRQRAFTLLSETYDDARRMVSFLRWKAGDADRFAPSWHRGPKPRRRRRVVDTDAAPGANEAAPSADATGQRLQPRASQPA